MQPERKKRGTSHGVSRARILLKKHMGWLPGFPLSLNSHSIRWRSVPWEMPGVAQTASLDREHIRRMEMTLTKLRYHFPIALPKLVEDVDDWLARMDHLLTVLKGGLHDQKPPDVRSWLGAGVFPHRWTTRFQELRAKHHTLTRFLDAVPCLELGRCSRPSLRLLRWIDEHAESLKRLATVRDAGSDQDVLDLQLTICLLRDELPGELESVLVDCLCHAGWWTVAVKDPYANLNELAAQLKKAADGKEFGIPDRQRQESICGAIRLFLLQVAAIKPPLRKSELGLLNLLLPRTVVSRASALTAAIQTEEEQILKRLRRVQSKLSFRASERTDRGKLKQQVESAKRVTRSYVMQHSGTAMHLLPEICQAGDHAAIWMRFLSHLPEDDSGLRLALFTNWEKSCRRHRRPDRAQRNLRHILSRLCATIAGRGLHPVLLSHWKKAAAADGHRVCEFVDDWLQEDVGHGILTRTVHLMEQAVYDQNLPVGELLLCSLFEIVKATPDDKRALKLVTKLAQRDDDSYYEEGIRAAFRIATDDDTIADVLSVLEGDYSYVEMARDLEHIPDERLRRIAHGMILQKNKKSLLRLSTCTQMLVALDCGLPQVQHQVAADGWLDRYPAALHGALTQLSKVTADAAEIAGRLLSKHFPQRCELESELAVIREKLTSSDHPVDGATKNYLQMRLEKLLNWMESPPSVSPRRLQNLASKLQKRADYELVQSYLRKCHELTGEHLRSSYQVDSFPDGIFEPPYDQLFCGVVRLKGSSKELGLRLLLQGFSPPVHDFRHEPQNVEFRKMMAAKGVNLEPWLDDGHECWTSTPAGERYRLFFTRDAKDYLMMGLHFDTCLSPGSINFFSTIANAVDINKQVLYGKSECGRIMGRCLFTLTDQGTILTYHRYAHDASEGFPAAVDRFASHLAEAMNTRVVSSGRVSTLVAKSWYDDGPMNGKPALDLRSPAGAVRTLLRSADPPVVLDRLRQIVGSDQTVKALLNELLFVDEFKNRPEIVRVFVEAYAFDQGVAFNEKLRLAVLSSAADLSGLADEVLQPLRPNSLPIRLKGLDCDYCSSFHGVGSYPEVFTLLIDHSPTIALRTIRATRHRGVRRDTEERHHQRRRALASIHRLLGRDQLADAIAGKQ